jgi:hypothetical protein
LQDGPRFGSDTHASLNTPAFSEYLLPYAVFGVSIVFATYRYLR